MKKYIITAEGQIISKYNNKVMKAYVDKKGYNHITLHIDGLGRKTKLIHRLVAQTHIPNPLKLPQVNHIDGNKSNNSVSNLEWCTGQQNVDHSIKVGLVAKGLARPNAKCSPEDIQIMKDMRAIGKTYYQIGKRFGIAYQTAHKICTNQTYQ